jgi:tetratricopeptide (TPR) repeat protein
MKPRRAALLAMGVALLAAAAYLPALPGAFHFDDFHSLVDNPMLDMATVPEIFTNPGLFSGLDVSEYRPVTLLSFALQAGRGPLRPGPLLAANLVIHGLACGIFFGVALLLLRSEANALLAAAVFALHPIQSEAVNYLSCRATLLASCLALAAILSLLLAARAGGWRRAAAYAGSAALLSLALLAKSEAFAAAFIPLLLALTVPRERWEGLRMGRAALMFLALAAAYLALRRLVGVEVMVPARPIRPIAANLATGPRAVLAYLGLFLWPAGLSVVHDLAPSAHWYDYRTWAAGSALLALLAAAYRERKERPLIFTGLCWFGLGLAPTVTLAPLHNVMAEHRTYFSMAGLALAAGEALGWLIASAGGVAPAGARRRGIAWAALALLVGCWLAGTVHRSREWRTEAALWRAAAQRSPANPTSWVNLGVAWWEAGRLKGSAAAFERALSLDPGNLPAMTNLGRIYVDEGELDQGVMILEGVLKQAPDEPEVHYNLGRAYALLKNYGLAEEQYQETLEEMPGHLPACENLAALYVYNLGEADKARQVMAHCLALRPSPDEVARLRGMLQDISRIEREREGPGRAGTPP